MRLAFYQPEIPQNTGTLMRLCACLGISLDIIHPCGFVWNDRHLQRAGMDYTDKTVVRHHTHWEAFQTWVLGEQYRLVLLDTKAQTSYLDFSFQNKDILMVGQESAGVPEGIFQAIPKRILIPMIAGCRSLNVSLAAAMVVGEGLRQVSALSNAG